MCEFMTSRVRNRTIGKSGFTLIEVLVGVLIIGVLMAFVLPNISKARTDAYQKKAEVELEMISTAILKMAWDTGQWPNAEPRNDIADVEVWNMNVTSAGLIGEDTDFSNWKGPYLPEIPLDPWGNPYFFDPDYRVDGVWRVVVGSFGPNGRGRNVYDEDNIYILLD
jgi:general secretion pathway protein G